MDLLPKVILGLFMFRLVLAKLSNSFCFFEKCLQANTQATKDKTSPAIARQTQIHHEWIYSPTGSLTTSRMLFYMLQYSEG
jgi:hypothetical protein